MSKFSSENESMKYIFEGAGNKRDELEQAILNELEISQHPFRAQIQTLKSGGLFGTKAQCVAIDIQSGNRIAITATTVARICMQRRI